MLTILLADDHAIVRAGLRMLIDSQPDLTVVAEAGDGEEAVALARQHQPALAVLDVEMPGLSGAEAARRILADSPHTRVVMLSMYASTEHVRQALEAGARGYVLKEAAAHDLLDAVRQVHQGPRYFSPAILELIVGEFIEIRAAAHDAIARLSSREREVLRLVVAGKSSREIAELIHLSPKTVETYRYRLMEKLGMHDLPSLIRFAITHKLIAES